MISDLLRRSNHALICERRSRTQGIRLAAVCAETPPAILPLADAQLYALWATKINHGDGPSPMGHGDGARKIGSKTGSKTGKKTGNEPGTPVRYIILRFRGSAKLRPLPVRGKMAKHAIFFSLALALCFVAPSAKPQDLSSKPQANDPVPRYTGQSLIRPENYREWIFLSSGLGMNYTPSANGREMFTNVFVPQWSYRQFLASGKWPDKSIFVVEERQSETNGSINKTGHFQTEFVHIGVEVKDESRFPEKWAYFSFDADTKTAAANPKAACWQCHEDHAAVEHTFVQFYPTLKEAAKKFGSYRTAAENPAP